MSDPIPGSLEVNNDSQTILIVDDNPANLRLLAKLLSTQGYTVRPAPSGALALMAVQQNLPDLILLDILMPKMDGFEVCQQLKSDPQTSDIPVIFMTALSDPADKVKGLSSGAVDYITKPFQHEEVLARVQLHLQLNHMTQTLDQQNHQLQRLTAELEQQVSDRTAALQESEECLRQLTENITSVFWLSNLDKSKLFYVSSAFEDIWGLPCTMLYQNPRLWLSTIHAEDRSEVMEALSEQLQGTYDQQYRILRSDGSLRWVRDRAFPIRDKTDQIYRIAGIVDDITERKEAEAVLQRSLQEKELLLKEIHHRVKNNLLVVSSLLELQANYLTDPQAIQYFEDSQHRIQSMALIHEKLYQSSNLAQIDLADYLDLLLTQLCNAFDARTRNIVATLDADSILLNLETITPCGLIVSELISNCFRHAFPPQQGGHLWVTAHQGPDQRITLQVRDDGLGLPADLDIGQTESLGLQLVSLLTQQLQGDIQVQRQGGTTFQLVFAELTYQERL
ncbi:MAG: response regulator [Leptolyngbyaceae cyanobacterium SM2_3_12]|nr:response regulator [Leptolyngbyaceae cyanobacterium SM2_3_12]